MSDTIKKEEQPSSIPVVEEKPVIGKKIIDKAKVIVSKTVNEESQVLNLPSINEQVQIERIPVNKVIDKIPDAIRYEGNTMIIPILQEITVVEKRILLAEEIRITKTAVSSTETKEITLRKEEIKIERNNTSI
jgi:uncharacterized protein (TIGR02271 family)